MCLVKHRTIFFVCPYVSRTNPLYMSSQAQDKFFHCLVRRRTNFPTVQSNEGQICVMSSKAHDILMLCLVRCKPNFSIVPSGTGRLSCVSSQAQDNISLMSIRVQDKSFIHVQSGTRQIFPPSSKTTDKFSYCPVK